MLPSTNPARSTDEVVEIRVSKALGTSYLMYISDNRRKKGTGLEYLEDISKKAGIRHNAADAIH